jgi:hypothetical protein
MLLFQNSGRLLVPKHLQLFKKDLTVSFKSAPQNPEHMMSSSDMQGFVRPGHAFLPA